MFIELLDGLRCTSDHPQIPLVAAILQRDARMVTSGLLGCPTCRREYPIQNGVAWFCPAGGEGEGGDADRIQVAEDAYDPDGALRVAAFLSVSEGATVVLAGHWARYAAELADLIALRIYAVNPRAKTEESEYVGVLHTDRRLPFADASLRGVAIDEPGWSVSDLQSAARALAPSGRMVAPASSPLPGDIEEIARDDHFWVGEKRAALVTLHRR